MTIVIKRQVDTIEFLKDKVLRKGDSGHAVTDLQKRLKNTGHAIVIDGDFGPATEKVVLAFQRKHGLVDDGAVGPKTFSVLDDARQCSKYLSKSDLVWAALELRIDIIDMLAINEVESKGSGFFSDGRPVILYERHIMRRRLIAAGIDPKPHIQKSPGLVNTNAGGYVGGVKEWIRLENAKVINVDAALESTSWGSYQIMGFHYELMGFEDVEDYVAFAMVSERNQLECFVRFVKSQPGIHKAIRNKDWASFANLYNGPAHQQYDLKINNAIKRFKTMFA